jgi:putative DNA primase/helicase
MTQAEPGSRGTTAEPFDRHFLDVARLMKMQPEQLRLMMAVGLRAAAFKDAPGDEDRQGLLDFAKEAGVKREDLPNVMISALQVEYDLKQRRESEIREERDRRRVRYTMHPWVEFYTHVPWPDPVSAGELLPQLLAAIRKHVRMDEHSALTVALWAMHTHVFDAFSTTPRLVIRSDAARAGKSTLLALISRLVPRPLEFCAGAAAAVLWSLGYRPVFLIDNAAALASGKELRALLHNGCQRSAAHVIRLAQGLTAKIDLFTPAAVTVEGRLPNILSGRSIEVVLDPLKPGDSVVRLHATAVEELTNLARMLTRWATDCRPALQRMDDAVASAADEIWLPLLLLAADAGQEWTDRASAAMQIIRGKSEPSLLTLLIGDISEIIEQRRTGQSQLPAPGGKYVADRDRIRSTDLARLLGEIEGRPWREWGKSAQPITPHALAILLAEARIRPATARFHTADQNGPGPDLLERGYLFDQFDDAFATHLPQDRIAAVP